MDMDEVFTIIVEDFDGSLFIDIEDDAINELEQHLIKAGLLEKIGEGDYRWLKAGEGEEYNKELLEKEVWRFADSHWRNDVRSPWEWMKETLKKKGVPGDAIKKYWNEYMNFVYEREYVVRIYLDSIAYYEQFKGGRIASEVVIESWNECMLVAGRKDLVFFERP